MTTNYAFITLYQSRVVHNLNQNDLCYFSEITVEQIQDEKNLIWDYTVCLSLLNDTCLVSLCKKIDEE